MRTVTFARGRARTNGAPRRAGDLAELEQARAHDVGADAEEPRRLQLVAIAEAVGRAQRGLLDARVQIGQVLLEPREQRGLEDVGGVRARRLDRRRHRGQPDVVGGDRLVAAHHQRAVDDVLELADVARPAVAEQALGGVGRQHRAAGAEALRVELEEVAGEGQDVAGAIAQRRQLERRDVEAVEEIGGGSDSQDRHCAVCSLWRTVCQR
jgi:hypothetical protein